MPRASRIVFSLIFFFLVAPAHAVDRLFVFSDGDTADLYNAETLDLMGSPVVGAGAFAAFGIPDPIAPGRFLKYLVLTPEAIVVVSPRPPIRILATVPLPVTLNRGGAAALLTADSRTLIMTGGEQVLFFDALDPEHPAPLVVELTGRPAGIAAPPGVGRLYVMLEDASQVRVINYAAGPPQLLAGLIELPAVPTAIVALPNGGAVLAAAPGRIFDLSPRTALLRGEASIPAGVPAAIGFDPDAPVANAFIRSGSTMTVVSQPLLEAPFSFTLTAPVRQAVSPGEARIYMLREDGQITRGDLESGETILFLHPVTNGAFPWPAVALAAGARGESFYAAFANGGPLMRLRADGTGVLAETPLAREPSGLAFTATPGVSTSRLEIYGGNQQFGTVGTQLTRPLAVRALDIRGNPVYDKRVTFTSTNPAVVLDPPETRTNLWGVALTYSSVPSNDPFEVVARLNDFFPTTFELNSGQAGQPGLSKASGDYQAVLENTALPRAMVLRAENSGVPTPSLDVTISADPPIVSCPAMVTTDSQGLASFECTAGASMFAPFPTEVAVQTTDSFGRVLADPFHVKVFARPVDMPRDPIRLSPGSISGPAGGVSIENLIRYRLIDLNGFPVSNVGLELSSEQDIRFPQPLIVSGADGVAGTPVQFGCKLETGTIGVTLNAPGLPEDEIAFQTTVGLPASIRQQQGDGQIGVPNQRLDGPGQALRARVTDSCGNGVGGQMVEWEVTPPGAATLENALTQSNTEGSFSAIVRLGSQAGPVEVTARIGVLSATFRLTISVVATRIEAVGGSDLRIPQGQTAPEPIVVQLTNESGGAAIGVPVTFQVLDGPASLTVNEDVTDAQGRARTTVIAGPAAGVARIEARAAGLSVVIEVRIIGRTPQVSPLGFVDGASFVPGWVPGSLGSIFGVGLMEGVEGVVQAAEAPFPFVLVGVRVWVNGVPAPIISVANINGQEQINLQIPFETPAPSEGVTVRIDNNGATAEFLVRTLTVQPGIFEVTLPGGRFAAALHADFSLVEPSNPARPGETILLFLTGLGPLDPPVGTNVAGPVPPAPTVETPTVRVEEMIAQSLGSFYAPTLYTVYQINFVVPDNAPSGNLRLTVNIRGAASRPVLLPVLR